MGSLIVQAMALSQALERPAKPPLVIQSEWNPGGISCCDITFISSGALEVQSSTNTRTKAMRGSVLQFGPESEGKAAELIRSLESHQFEVAWSNAPGQAASFKRSLGAPEHPTFDKFRVGGPFLGGAVGSHPPRIGGDTAFIWGRIEGSHDLWALFSLRTTDGALTYKGLARVPEWPIHGRVELDPTGRYIGVLTMQPSINRVKVSVTDLTDGERRAMVWRTPLRFGTRYGQNIEPEDLGFHFMRWTESGELLLMATRPEWMFLPRPKPTDPPPNPPPPGEGLSDLRPTWQWGQVPLPDPHKGRSKRSRR